MTQVCACHTGPYTPCDYLGGCGSPGGCCATPETQVLRCTVCHRKSTAPICQACSHRATNQLAEIPSLLSRLAYATVTSSPGVVEFVSGGAFGSRPPLRVDALSLTVVTPDAIGFELTDPQPPTGEAGDSIPLWTIAWAAVWRQRLGHHQPAGTRLRPGRVAAAVRDAFARQGSYWGSADVGADWAADRCSVTELPETMCAHCRGISDPVVEADPYPPLSAPVPRRINPVALAAQLDERARQVRFIARVQLGLEVARMRDPRDPQEWRRVETGGTGDGLAEHWLSRFGEVRQIHRIMADLAYLATWLDVAMDQFDDADRFVVGLRSLVAAGRAAVGERSDVVSLGRCPELLPDRDTGQQEPCGAWLARDAMVSMVVCPRCRTETGERGLLELARRMRDVYAPNNS
jgi:hypothetical protein